MLWWKLKRWSYICIQVEFPRLVASPWPKEFVVLANKHVHGGWPRYVLFQHMISTLTPLSARHLGTKFTFEGSSHFFRLHTTESSMCSSAICTHPSGLLMLSRTRQRSACDDLSYGNHLWNWFSLSTEAQDTLPSSSTRAICITGVSHLAWLSVLQPPFARHWSV